MVHELSCSVACGIFPDQGSNLGLLNWQEDSLSLSQQGSPKLELFLKRTLKLDPLNLGLLQSCLERAHVRPLR